MPFTFFKNNRSSSSTVKKATAKPDALSAAMQSYQAHTFASATMPRKTSSQLTSASPRKMSTKPKSKSESAKVDPVSAAVNMWQGHSFASAHRSSASNVVTSTLPLHRSPSLASSTSSTSSSVSLEKVVVKKTPVLKGVSSSFHF
ncbi:hypothetical protein PYCC9005_000169 [Savitreella phatthalungensis]